ncbi:MAG: RNA polymerase sigma factor [Prevotellaceae bacterium]|nr:RNA polymerase sigma factor [Prevotellaceae bacterium]
MREASTACHASLSSERSGSLWNDVLPLKDKLFRLALRITLNRAEAEDVVQDTLLRVWNERGKWQQIRSLEAFSLTVCRNLALDRQKRASATDAPLTEREHEMRNPLPQPDELVLRKERLRLVRETMDSLPEMQRTLMLLRDVEGKTYKEIAETLAVSEAQVKVYLHRARQRIKKTIEEIENYGL